MGESKLNLYAKEENIKKQKMNWGNLGRRTPNPGKCKIIQGNSYHQRKSEALHGTVVANWADGTPLVTIGNGKRRLQILASGQSLIRPITKDTSRMEF